MNGLMKSLFFASAFAPAVLVSALLQFMDVGGKREIYGWIVASILACIFPLLVVNLASKKAEILNFSAKKVESQDWLLVVFVVAYFVPLITKVQDLQVFIPLFLGAAILMATLDAIPCHPLLHVMRYRFYKVEGVNGIVYTLISRRQVLTASDIKKVKQLSPQLLLEA